MARLGRAAASWVARHQGMLAILSLVLLFAYLTPVGQTLWAVRLIGEGRVDTGDWKPPPVHWTSIEVEKTAVGYWETEGSQIETAPDPEEDEGLNQSSNGVGPGDNSVGASGKKDGDPPAGAGGDEAGVRGEVCVANIGEAPTEGLEILDQVEFKLAGQGKFQPLEGASLTIVPSEQIAPGERRCYAYEIAFNPVEGAKAYRNTAHVTILNQAGHQGEPFGPTEKADFELPAEPEVQERRLPAPQPTAVLSESPTPTPTPTLTDDESATATQLAGGELRLADGDGSTETTTPTATLEQPLSPTPTAEEVEESTSVPSTTESEVKNPAPTPTLSPTPLAAAPAAGGAASPTPLPPTETATATATPSSP